MVEGAENYEKTAFPLPNRHRERIEIELRAHLLRRIVPKMASNRDDAVYFSNPNDFDDTVLFSSFFISSSKLRRAKFDIPPLLCRPEPSKLCTHN